MKLSKSSWGIIACATVCFLSIIGISQQSPQQPSSEPIDILAITNLEQSKVAITGLKKLGGFNDKYGQHWLVEQHGHKIGLPIILSEDTNTVRYSAVLISADCFDRIETNHVSEIQTQTPNMNITRHENWVWDYAETPKHSWHGVTKSAITG